MRILSDFHVQWTLVLAIPMLFWVWQWLRPQYGTPAALLFGYLCLSSLWVWVWKDNRYISINVYDQTALRYFSADSLAKILLVFTPLMALANRRESLRTIGEVLIFSFMAVNCVWIAWSLLRGCWAYQLSCGGMIGNPSISVGMMACMLPIVLRSWRKQKILFAMCAVAVFGSQSSIAIGLFAIYCAAWMLKNAPKVSFKALVPAGALCGGVFLAAKLALGAELMDSSGRFLIWKTMMSYWAAPWNLWFGTGLGTYHVFSINLQHAAQVAVAPGEWWNTLHNDPLQMLFEGGIVGAALMVLTYFSALYKAIKENDWPIAMSVLLFGLYMTLDPALHNPIPALFGAWLFVYALRKNPQTLRRIEI